MLMMTMMMMSVTNDNSNDDHNNEDHNKDNKDNHLYTAPNNFLFIFYLFFFKLYLLTFWGFFCISAIGRTHR